jgi:hypothetical protein
MTTGMGLARLAPGVGILLVFLFALHDRFDLVGARILTLIGIVVAAAGLVLRWRDARGGGSESPEANALRMRALVAFGSLGAVSIALAVVRAVVLGRGALRDDLVAALLPPLLGWSVFLLLPLGHAPRPAAVNAPETRSRTHTLWLVAGAAFVAIWIATLVRSHFESIDEVLYALQAHRFAIGDVTWPADSSLQRFVKLPLMVVTPASVFPQYPPGYPAILSVFVRFGIPSLSGAVLGALAVLATQRLGARAATASVGLLSALLLATHELFLRWASIYMSHLATLTAVCFAAWLVLDASARTGRARDVESVGAGFLLGVAIAVRPVTGLAIGLPIWLFLLARRTDWTQLRRVTVMACAGVILPFAGLLTYNAVTNGNPMRLGYQAALGHLTDVGFGPRGFILYDRDVRPVVSATEFTLGEALRTELGSALWPLLRDLIPMWGLLPLVAVAIAYRVRLRPAVVAAFAVLPIVNFLYFSNGTRLYVELLPFVLVAVAIVVRAVHDVDARAARALAVFLVGANVVSSTTWIAAEGWKRRAHPSDSEVVARAVVDSAGTAGPILVFVQNPPLSEPLLIGLSRFNFGWFPGRVVVARDLGPENARLACRLPGYRALRAEPSTTARDARLVSYPDGVTASARCDLPRLDTSTPDR